MTPAAPIPEDRHGRILAELAGMGLELARDLRERALAAETAEEATRLARAFQSISRGLRQTLALELKVARFRQQMDREIETRAADEARRAADARAPLVRRRREEVASTVEQLIWSEHEGHFDEDEAERLQVRLNDWLAAASDEPDFTAANVDELIIEACVTLGLDPGRLYEGFDDAPADPDTPPEGEGLHPESPIAADSG